MQNRYSTSSSFCNLPDCFQNCYTFCRQDGGDCSPSAPSMRFSAVSPALNLPPLSKVRCCHPKEFGRLPEGLLPIRTNPPKTALSHEKHPHPRLLKSIQTKLKTAPVTLRERFCISLYYQFATMFTSLPGTTISLRIVLPSSDCAIASFAIFSSSSLSAAVGTFIRAFILPQS